MADDIGGVWRTVGGRRIFIKDGQDLASAMKESGKFNTKTRIKDGINKTLKEMKDEELQELKNKTKNDEVKKTVEDEINKRNNEKSTKKILYHQTKVESLEDFNESNRQAGLSDTSTPKGIFLKDTDEDIGLAGKNQLKMEATMEKPLNVKDRKELKEIVSKNNERYKNIIENEGKTDDYYSKLNDDIEAKIDKLYEKEYNATGEEKQRLKTQIDNLMLQQDDVLDQWTNSGKNIAKVAQSEMTRTLKSLGYDSVILEEDVGSFGRKVKSYIVFDVKQLKQIK